MNKVSSKLKRLLLVGDYPPPFGGIAVHVAQLLTYLRERQIDARVLNIGKGKSHSECVEKISPQGLLQPVAKARVEGWPVHLHTSGNNRKSWLLALAVGAMGAQAGQMLTLHSGLMPAFLQSSFADRSIARAALARFSTVVFVSHRQHAATPRLEGPQTATKIIPAFLASSVRPGQPPSTFLRARERHFPVLSMAYHPSPTYGIRLAYGAMSLLKQKFPRMGLVLFGPGVEPATEAVTHLGELEHAAALAVIQQSDAFLRPTLADGDAISVREALALGTRCVASDAADRPPGTMVFSTGNAQSLADAVTKALQQRPPDPGGDDAGPKLLSTYENLL